MNVPKWRYCQVYLSFGHSFVPELHIHTQVINLLNMFCACHTGRRRDAVRLLPVKFKAGVLYPLDLSLALLLNNPCNVLTHTHNH